MKQVKEANNAKGHISALVTIFIWGTAFVSTRILLTDFRPIEIIFYRFTIGLLVLMIAYPRRLKVTDKKEELMFVAAGLCGVALYFLLENIALMYTAASNVGVIISVSPFFTALLANWLLDGEKLKVTFFIGFITAIIGIALISFNGITVLRLNPIGDILALLAAIVWAVYSILLRKISQFGHNTIQTTRRIFCYGLIILVPALLLFPFEFGLERFAQPVNIFNILFLGLGASALCFATWNLAVRTLGAVKTSIYIYLVPVITVVVSVIVLAERVTWMSALGTILTLTGLFISGKKSKDISKKQTV
jgi:drug/metabolite transporter (DMT)-like permease